MTLVHNNFRSPPDRKIILTPSDTYQPGTCSRKLPVFGSGSCTVQLAKRSDSNQDLKKPTKMPKQVQDIKLFLEIARRKDAKSARIRKSKDGKIVKFKVRCSKYLYTLVVADTEKVMIFCA